MKTFHQQHQGTRANYPLQRQFKGGGGGTVPPAIPPVAQSSTEVADAERQAKLAAANRKGMKATLLAGGEANGGGQASNLGGKTLLG